MLDLVFLWQSDFPPFLKQVQLYQMIVKACSVYSFVFLIPNRGGKWFVDEEVLTFSFGWWETCGGEKKY